jgi:hypothetical protein
MRLVAFVVSFLTALLVVNCAGQQLTPAQQKTLDLFECRVHALQPFVGGIYDTAGLVRQWTRGNQDLIALLKNLGYLQQEVESAAAAVAACNPVALPPASPGEQDL